MPAGQSHTLVEESEEEELSEDEMMSEEEMEETREVEDHASMEDSDNEELLDINSSIRDLGTHVVAEYEGQWFLTEVCRDQSGVPRGYTRLSYMVIKGKNSFGWGAKADVVTTLDEDILLTHVVPEPVNSRGHLGLKKSDLQTVLARMVMVFFLFFKSKFSSN